MIDKLYSNTPSRSRIAYQKRASPEFSLLIPPLYWKRMDYFLLPCRRHNAERRSAGKKRRKKVVNMQWREVGGEENER